MMSETSPISSAATNKPVEAPNDLKLTKVLYYVIHLIITIGVLPEGRFVNSNFYIFSNQYAEL